MSHTKTAQHGTVLHYTTHYSTAQPTTSRGCTTLHITEQFVTSMQSTAQHRSVQCSKAQRSTAQCSTEKRSRGGQFVYSWPVFTELWPFNCSTEFKLRTLCSEKHPTFKKYESNFCFLIFCSILAFNFQDS